MELRLLHMFCATTYVFLAIYIGARKPRTALHQGCIALFVCFAWWSGTLVVAHDPTATRELAQRAYDVGALAWGSFGSLIPLFCAIFVGRAPLIRNRAFQLALGLPALISIWAQWSGRLCQRLLPQAWGWAFVWSRSAWSYAFFAYYSIYTTLGLTAVFVAARRADDPRRRQQAWITLLTAAPPLLLSSVTDVLAPLAGHHWVPNVAPDFTVIWALGLVYAIVRHRMFELTPGLAVDEIVGAMSDSLLLLDRDHRVVYGNPAAHGLLGRRSGELQGMPLREALALGDDPQTRRLFDPHGEGVRTEQKLATVGGAEVPVIISTAPLWGPASERVGTVCIATDVTELKRAEAALRRARDSLERRVAERTEALEAQMVERQQLQSKLAQADRMASVGMLAAGVAHEINNPLTYVLYNLDAVTELAPTATTPSARQELAEAAAEAREGAARVAAIVKDLRTFSRVEDDRLSAVDLNAVIGTALSMASNQIRYRAQLEQDLGELPVVVGHEGRLSQVFLNLLVNAAQAIPEGHVTDNTIRVSTRREGDMIVAEVEDSGEGISASQLERLFDPFFSTKEAGVGSGLGLAICQRIITSYRGSIVAESEPGEGARFIIRLPAARDEDLASLTKPAEAPDERAGAQPVAEQSPRGRLLVVDDERSVRHALVRLLSGRHEVVAVESGEGAMELLSHDRAFDVVISDLMMPGLSGMDLFEWLSGEDAELAKKVIFISGGVFTPRARGLLGRCDNPRFEKPLDTKVFTRAIDRAVESSREGKASA